MMPADNGSPWFVSGAPDRRWNDDDLHQLQTLYGSDFEVADVSLLMLHPDSDATTPEPGRPVAAALHDTHWCELLRETAAHRVRHGPS